MMRDLDLRSVAHKVTCEVQYPDYKTGHSLESSRILSSYRDSQFTYLNMSSASSSSFFAPISAPPNKFVDGDLGGNMFADSITRFDKGPYPEGYWVASAVGAG